MNDESKPQAFDLIEEVWCSAWPEPVAFRVVVDTQDPKKNMMNALGSMGGMGMMGLQGLGGMMGGMMGGMGGMPGFPNGNAAVAKSAARPPTLGPCLCKTDRLG